MSQSILDDLLVEELLSILEPVERQLLKTGNQSEASQRVYQAMEILRRGKIAALARTQPSSLPGDQTELGLHTTMLAHATLSKLRAFLLSSGESLGALPDGSLAGGFKKQEFDELVLAHAHYREGVRKHLKSI